MSALFDQNKNRFFFVRKKLVMVVMTGLNTVYSIDTRDIQNTHIVNIQRIRVLFLMRVTIEYIY